MFEPGHPNLDGNVPGALGCYTRLGPQDLALTSRDRGSIKPASSPT